MKYEKLGFLHKEQLEKHFTEIEIPLSEYSFANLYLFRKNHDYEIIDGKQVFLKGKTYDGESYIMPTTDISNIDFNELKKLLKPVDFLFPVPEDWLPYFPENEF